jgi:class 3 adenylate cyclase/tetratricopeptide (TPR) repeat protein
MALHLYLSQDRLRALARQQTLPAQAQGAALFADISGFTKLTEALALRHGERRGVEVLTQLVGEVYDALITEVERFGGSTLTFAGDAITCWFDDADDAEHGAPAAARAVQAALTMQRGMQAAADAAATAATTDAPNGQAAPLALKVSVASGTAQRLAIGDASIQTLDVLVGSTVTRVAMADALAQPGDVLLDEATAAAVLAPVLARRVHATGLVCALLDPAWRGPLQHTPPRPVPVVQQPPAEVLRPWVLPFVFERETAGQGLFVTDLRPVVALFLRFDVLAAAGGEAQGDLDTAATQRLDRWITGAQRVLQQHGGVLLELIPGDKGSYLYAAFGAAKAHEDDTPRALRAALALRTLFDDGSPGAGAHIGMASGTLRVGGYGGRSRQSFGAQGDAVNAAARLMGLAQRGEILTSGRLRGAGASEFALQARPPIALKGRAEPMPVFALLGPQRQRAIRLQEPDFVLPMVGRDAEAQWLEEALQRVAEGRGEVLAVVADAGMGKSRLLAEGVRLALRRGFVGYGGATAGDGVRLPYSPWQGVWTALLALDTAQSPRLQARTVEAAVARLAPERAEAWPLLGPLLGLELADNSFTQGLAPRDRKALLEALLVEALASAADDAALDGAGVLLVLEDLHAAEALSLDLLAAVVGAIAARPVLVLLSQRPPEGTHQPDIAQRLLAPAAVLGGDAVARVQRLKLMGLDAAQTEQLVRAKLAVQFPERPGTVPTALIDRIVERAQGNPFCVEELLNHLYDRGLDPQRAESAQALDWPVSLRRLVLSRIDRLTPPAQQQALKVASVIGRQFRLAEVQACHPPDTEHGRLHGHLAQLTRLGLTAEWLDEPEPAFFFTQRVTQEVAYDSIAHGSRLRLHEQLALHLEAQQADTPGRLAPPLAHHWARAERPDRAWPHLLRAAEQAAASYANEEALAAFGQVLAWLPAGALKERVDVLLRCESLHELLGQHAQRRRVLAELGPLVHRLTDAEAVASLRRTVELRGVRVDLDVGDCDAAAAGARAVLEDAPASDLTPPTAGPAQRLEALLLLAWAQFSSGQTEPTRATLDRALTLARQHGLQDEESRALSQLGLVAWQAGRYDEAEALLMQALPALQASGALRRQLDVLNNLGIVAKARGRIAQAVAFYEEAQAIARRIGDRSGEATLLHNMGGVWQAAGDFPRAALKAERAAQIWATLNEPSQLGAALCNLAEAHRELGQYAVARATGEQALALLRANGQRRGEATVLENLGRVAMAVGDTARAMQTLQAALALAREIGRRPIEASTLMDLGRLHTRLGERAAADQALQAAARLMAELCDPMGVLEVQAARAEWWMGDAAPTGAAAACAELATALPRLVQAADDGVALPMALYLVAWRALVAAGDERAGPLLASARAELRARAARIADPTVRRDYLQAPEHRALLVE